jgi:hypothetical protein
MQRWGELPGPEPLVDPSDDTALYRRAALNISAGSYRLNWWRNVFIFLVGVISLANLVVNVVSAVRMT